MKENRFMQEETERLMASPFSPPKYNAITSNTIIPELICDLIDHSGNKALDFNFLLSPSYSLKGWFSSEAYDEDDEDFSPFFFIVQLITSPVDTTQNEGNNKDTHSKLQNALALGILNSKGDCLLKMEYESIKYSGWEDYFKVEKNGKYGMFSTSKGFICPAEYDQITDFSEGVFGVVKDGSLGFMDAQGALIVPIEYVYYKNDLPLGYNNGLLYLYSFTDDYRYLSYKAIDHSGNVIKKGTTIDPVEEFYDIQFENSSNNCYDRLDAYEGDPGNLWNTD